MNHFILESTLKLSGLERKMAAFDRPASPNMVELPEYKTFLSLSKHYLVSDVHKKIKAAFEAFDYESNNTVDVREIGTIIYSLGCFPSQKDLHDFITEVEEDHSGYIHLNRFLPAMAKLLLENRFAPIAEDLLLQAFEVLDKEKKGYLEPEELMKYMTQEGEPFTQEEMDEMLTALADPEKNYIYYKDLISQLTIDSNM